MKNGKVYVGKTSRDPEIRIAEHNEGLNQWSKQNRPLKLIYYEAFVCKEDVSNREKFYKSGIGRRVKIAIVKEFDK